jgi:hypothetical protein
LTVNLRTVWLVTRCAFPLFDWALERLLA